MTCLNEMDGEELVRELDVKKKVVGIVATAAAIAILLWAGVVFSEMTEHNEEMDGYFTEGIVNVVRQSNEKGE